MSEKKKRKRNRMEVGAKNIELQNLPSSSSCWELLTLLAAMPLSYSADGYGTPETHSPAHAS